jgi:hypothetical protein
MKDVRTEVTMSEHERPGLERSSMYQSAGLTRARVNVSCKVDCHGSRRCEDVSPTATYQFVSLLTIAKAIPTKAATLRTTSLICSLIGDWPSDSAPFSSI